MQFRKSYRFRINVSSSLTDSRKITTWIDGLCNYELFPYSIRKFLDDLLLSLSYMLLPKSDTVETIWSFNSNRVSESVKLLNGRYAVSSNKGLDVRLLLCILVTCHTNPKLDMLSLPGYIYQLLARWTTEHYYLSSNLGMGISEGCFIFYFASLPLEVAWAIQPTMCTKVAVKHQSSSQSRL